MDNDDADEANSYKLDTTQASIDQFFGRSGSQDAIEVADVDELFSDCDEKKIEEAKPAVAQQAVAQTVAQQAVAQVTQQAVAHQSAQVAQPEEHADADKHSEAEGDEQNADDVRCAEEKELAAILGNGSLSCREKWGLRFARSASGGRSVDYHDKSRAEKAQFRLDWVKCQLETRTRSKSKDETFKKANKEITLYLSMAQIIEKRGGYQNPLALTAANNYAESCEAKKGDWLSYDEDTKERLYKYVERSMGATHEHSWGLHEKFDDTPLALSGGADADAEPASSKASSAPIAVAAKRGAKTKPIDDKTGDDKKASPQTKKLKTKNALDCAIEKAVQVKKELATTSMQASSLLSQMAMFPDTWGWANSSELKEAFGKLAPVSIFGQRFMCLATKEIRAEFRDQDAEFQANLTTFSSDMGDEVQRTRALLKKLLGGHAAARAK